MIIIYIMIWTNENFQRLKNKDPVIFNKFFNAYKEKIYNFLIIKANGNHSVAEDIFSDTFHSAFLSLEKLKNANNISAWLFKIAYRRFNDYLRKQYKEKICSDEINKEYTTSENVIEILDKKEKGLLTATILEELKPEYKDVLIMRYIEDKTQKEIAKKMNKSINAIRILILRAKKSFKNKSKKYKKAFGI